MRQRPVAAANERRALTASPVFVVSAFMMRLATDTNLVSVFIKIKPFLMETCLNPSERQRLCIDQAGNLTGVTLTVDQNCRSLITPATKGRKSIPGPNCHPERSEGSIFNHHNIL